MTILVLEYLKGIKDTPGALITTIVYSDSMLEFPQAKTVALDMMRFIQEAAQSENLPVETRYVKPQAQDSFWVKMIGLGYTPPRAHFRWCTPRLKVNPSKIIIAENPDQPKAVLTGVRFDESSARKANLTASCAKGGECGQDFWMRYGPNGSNVTYFAPVISWRTCKVWDFLTLVAPSAGWPTGRLTTLYGGQSLRFGCWTCTLVRRDKAAEALIARGEGDVVAKLTEFRSFIDEASRIEGLRRRDAAGTLRGFTLAFCRELLDRLLELQREVRLNLISHEEIRAILEAWKVRELAESHVPIGPLSVS